MSSTSAQLDANRANAQLSTGPKTEAGKPRAALNHVMRQRRTRFHER